MVARWRTWRGRRRWRGRGHGFPPVHRESTAAAVGDCCLRLDLGLAGPAGRPVPCECQSVSQSRRWLKAVGSSTLHTLAVACRSHRRTAHHNDDSGDDGGGGGVGGDQARRQLQRCLHAAETRESPRCVGSRRGEEGRGEREARGVVTEPVHTPPTSVSYTNLQ